MRYIRDDLPKRLKRSARTPKRRHFALLTRNENAGSERKNGGNFTSE